MPKLRFVFAAALALAVLGAGAAAARPVSDQIIVCSQVGCLPQAAGIRVDPPIRGIADDRRDPRPKQWCAWWLRRHLGVPRSAFRPWEYNLAYAFRYIGRPAGGPAVGVIVVWRSHVGIITGRGAKGWIVHSGNDGGAVRERERSLKAAVAFRWPP